MAASGLLIFLVIFSTLAADDTIQDGGGFVFSNLVQGLNVSQYTATTLDVLKNSGIIEILEVGGPFTFFSPDRLAFERLGDTFNKKFRNDTKAMADFIKFHTVRHVYTFDELHVNEKTLWTLHPQRIRLNYYRNGDTLLIQGSRVMAKNMRTKNGIIHVVHDAFFPPIGNIMDVLYNDPDYTTFIHALQITGMIKSMQDGGPFTVFAPENTAFVRFGVDEWQKLQTNVTNLRKVLEYHVIRGTIYSVGVQDQSYPSLYRRSPLKLTSTIMGDKIYANGAVVKEKDTHATNGVVHKLTKLLTPADLFDVIHFKEPYGSNKNTNYSQIVG
ncbi:transforming growth factor-beta-induced protein ig-h3-like [Mytilus trossulus]|uniref:transforming growth factor-beta-induced protein ig-h3-like n=1 Tax=Mytilus trossulus TaxID=6551 RepID=UPI0030075124